MSCPAPLTPPLPLREVRRGCRECPVDIHAAERVQTVLLHPGGNSRVRGSCCNSPRKGGGNNGFTLIEVAVVMLVIVIVLGIVSVNLEPDRDSIVRDEANRLTLLLQTARQESILQGKVIAVVIERQGYYFLVMDDKSEFKPLSQDDVLYPRPLPSGISITSVEIEGAPETEKPRLILLPTGELQSFSVTFSRGSTRWNVKGELTGEITSRIAPLPGKV